MAQRAMRAERTVGEVARHDTGAVEVMKRTGIHHCCGARLALAEAAAAGVPVETLREALNRNQPRREHETPP